MSLTGLEIFGLILGFVGLVASKLFKPSREDAAGRIALTSAGKIGLAIAAVGVLISIGSALIKRNLEATAAAESERRVIEDKIWKDRTKALESEILAKTDLQLRKSQDEFSRTLAAFEVEQQAILKTNRSVLDSRDRLLTPLGTPSINAKFSIDCRDPEDPSTICNDWGTLKEKAAKITDDQAVFVPVLVHTTIRVEYCLFHSRADATRFSTSSKPIDCDLGTSASAGTMEEAVSAATHGDVGTALVATELDSGSTLFLLDASESQKHSVMRSGNISSLLDVQGGAIFVSSSNAPMDQVKTLALAIGNEYGQMVYVSAHDCRHVQNIYRPLGTGDADPSHERTAALRCDIPKMSRSQAAHFSG